MSPSWSGFSCTRSRCRPYVPYIHLLVDYHFGFTKRALIGAVVSLFTDKVPVWLVFALGGAVWLITARPVRPAVPADLRLRREAPAAVRVHGGLAVLPQEFHAHARAFRHLRLPVRDRACCWCRRARSAFVWLAALFSIVLVLIHHIHLLMYVPTIARHRGAASLSRPGVDARERQPSASPRRWRSARCSSPRNSTGRCRCRRRSSSLYLQSRMADPSRDRSAEFLPTSGTSRSRRKFATPGRACPPISWACRCLRC